MNFKRAAVIFLFFVLPCASLYGQKEKRHQIDSLKRELSKSSNPDTLNILILLELSMKYQSFETDTAMAYAQESLKKSEDIQFTRGRADALLHIGRLKRDQNDDANALKDMFVALKLYREIRDSVQIANSLNDISIIYATSGDFEESLEYFQQALIIFQQMGDRKGESYALNNIGLIYQELHDEAKAKEYFIRSLKIKEERNDVYGISRGYANLGSIAEDNEQWGEALQYYVKADSLYEKTKDLQVQAMNLIAIARIKQKQGKLPDAKRFASSALEKAKSVKSLSVMLSAYKFLSAFEERQQNFKASLAYQKLYSEIADSLNNENHNAILEELKTKFNVEEKEREIVLLKKDKELQQAILDRKTILTYALIGGILLMVAVLGLVYVAYQTTKSKKNILAIKNAEISRQNDALDKLNKEKDRFFSILSHDLKGPLSSLKGLSYLLTMNDAALTPDELLQMRTKINHSLDNLTELINNILEWSMATSQKRQWTFVKINTAELIQKNLSLYQSIAESKGVNLKCVNQETCYGYADYHAIDTVIRNLLSNSIKYSHANQDVLIATRREAQTIYISVKDQGVGMTQEIQDNLFTLKGHASRPGTHNEKGTGLGLTLCMELIKENQGQIHVKSQVGEGSEFIVTIPEYA